MCAACRSVPKAVASNPNRWVDDEDDSERAALSTNRFSNTVIIRQSEHSPAQADDVKDSMSREANAGKTQRSNA